MNDKRTGDVADSYFGVNTADEFSDLRGWERRTTIDEPRLTELVELYEELGFEVLLRPVDQRTQNGGCRECFLVDPERFRIIYTRKYGDPTASEEGDP